MNPRTVIYLMHFTDDDPDHAVLADFERPGEILVQEQLSSWMRECAIKFFEKLNEDNSICHGYYTHGLPWNCNGKWLCRCGEESPRTCPVMRKAHD